jgi:hypothetical protein
MRIAWTNENSWPQDNSSAITVEGVTPAAWTIASSPLARKFKKINKKILNNYLFLIFLLSRVKPFFHLNERRKYKVRTPRYSEYSVSRLSTNFLTSSAKEEIRQLNRLQQGRIKKIIMRVAIHSISRSGCCLPTRSARYSCVLQTCGEYGAIICHWT